VNANWLADSQLCAGCALQVLVRLKPAGASECDCERGASRTEVVRSDGTSNVHLVIEDRKFDFQFDEVVGTDGTQEDIFKRTPRAPRVTIPRSDLRA
jgi:hypothetical protein